MHEALRTKALYEALHEDLHKALYRASVVEPSYAEPLYVELSYAKLLCRAFVSRALCKALCRASCRALYRAVGSQLLLSYYKDGIDIGTSGVNGGNGSVVENESPKLKLALYELLKLRYKLL